MNPKFAKVTNCNSLVREVFETCQSDTGLLFLIVRNPVPFLSTNICDVLIYTILQHVVALFMSYRNKPISVKTF